MGVVTESTGTYIRQKPDTKAQGLLLAPKGGILKILESSKPSVLSEQSHVAWTKIEFSKRIGYVLSSHIQVKNDIPEIEAEYIAAENNYANVYLVLFRNGEFYFHFFIFPDDDHVGTRQDYSGIWKFDKDNYALIFPKSEPNIATTLASLFENVKRESLRYTVAENMVAFRKNEKRLLILDVYCDRNN